MLSGAQQFRSQVHRRVVGNSGSSLFGRMDGDELATLRHAVLSPATRTKLATLEKGQLMVRHPHFTSDVKRFFTDQFKSHVPVRPPVPTPVTPLRPTSVDDPYGI